MLSGPQIIRKYVKDNQIDMTLFHEYVDDSGIAEHELNHHDSRYLSHLEDYVEFRSEYMEANNMTLEEFNS